MSAKTIRIGCGSGGCSYERMEPALDLAERGNIDYLVFECLSERTITELQLQKREDPSRGYNPMLAERMERFISLALKHGFKIVSNMGGANVAAAVDAIAQIARAQGLHPKIAAVYGDDILPSVASYADLPLYQEEGKVSDCLPAISANVYMGCDGIRAALDQGADIIITGRVADASLFMGPLLHEFNWAADDADRIGQGLLVGHMMECASQLTGGYFADPGYKDVEGLERLGHPIAEVSETGRVLFTKLEGTGGCVSVDICKEQLLYEIGDPSRYLTPDGVADFSQVTFAQVGPNLVEARGARSHSCTDTYKVNIGRIDSYIGIGEISFGGSTAYECAQLCADVVLRRWKVIGIEPLEFRVDYIGCNSLYGDKISRAINPGPYSELRLRIAVRARSSEEARLLIREMSCLYINGPAGAAGIRTSVEPSIELAGALIPRAELGVGTVSMMEV